MPAPQRGDFTFFSPRTGDVITDSLNDVYSEGFRLRDVEDQRYQESLGFARGEFDRFANTPAISDEEITTRFGQAAEQIGADTNTAYGNARAALGDAGFFSGAGAALAGQIETARLGQLTGASRDLRLYKARLDTDKAMQRIQAAGMLADRMNQSPSALGLDVLGAGAGLNVTREGYQLGAAAARDQASASKKAGKASAASGIVGSAIPIFGG